MTFCKRLLPINTLLLFTDNCAANENTGDVPPYVTGAQGCGNFLPHWRSSTMY
jgi:hypothetical protein